MRKEPKQDRGKQKVRDILDAAKRLLIANGYECFTTNHVAKEAACNIAAIYRYFPEKNGLITALYVEYLEQAVADAQAFLQEPANNSLSLEDLVTGLFAIFTHVSDDEHKYALELTKAQNMNRHIDALGEEFDLAFLDLLTTHYSANERDFPLPQDEADYLQNYALALVLMINMAVPGQRPFMIQKATQGLRLTVRDLLKTKPDPD